MSNPAVPPDGNAALPENAKPAIGQGRKPYAPTAVNAAGRHARADMPAEEGSQFDGLVPKDASGRALPHGPAPDMGSDGMARGGDAYGRGRKMLGPPDGARGQLAALKAMAPPPMLPEQGYDEAGMMSEPASFNAVEPEEGMPQVTDPSAMFSTPAVNNPTILQGANPRRSDSPIMDFFNMIKGGIGL